MSFLFKTFNECDCPGHGFLYVEHIMACCDKPHITEEEWHEKYGFPIPKDPDEPARGD